MPYNNNRKIWIFFGVSVALFVLLVYMLFLKASDFDSLAPAKVLSVVGNSNYFDVFMNSIQHNIAEPAAMLLLQIIAILMVSRVFGWFFVRIGQPTVIGEILAGIVLGPSLLGYFWPETYHFLFNADSLSNIYIISESAFKSF